MVDEFIEGKKYRSLEKVYWYRHKGTIVVALEVINYSVSQGMKYKALNGEIKKSFDKNSWEPYCDMQLKRI